MILKTLLEQPEDQPTDGGENQRWTSRELAPIYNSVKNRRMSLEDIKALGVELADGVDYNRTAYAVFMTAARMHALIHGMLPDGVSGRDTEAEFDRYSASKPIYDFILSQGEFDAEDLDQNWRAAQAEGTTRQQKVNKTKEKDAVADMATYYMANKTKLPTDIRQHRDEIVQNIMKGLTPDEAFGRYIREQQNMTFLDFLTEDKKQDTQLLEDFSKIEDEFSSIQKRIGVVNEMGPAPGQVAPTGNMDQILRGMDIVTKQMNAARKAMGMLNTMKDSEFRTKNRSRVMGNMNRIRANIQRIEKLLSASN